MPEISLTEDQHERLVQVRDDLEEAFLDDYGYIPLEDVVEYLLDTYTPPQERDAVDAYERLVTAEYPQLQRVASDVPDVPGSGIDADEMRGRLLAELGVEQFTARLAQTADGSTEGVSATNSGSDDTGEPSGSPDPGGGATDGATSADDGHASAGGVDEETAQATDSDDDSTTPPSTGGVSLGGGGGDPLAAANQMLREHDDKWREGSDEPYEVDLPDGGTESARTRDDVRQLLFRHYSS